MERFVERHREAIEGVLTGFDRIRFGGTLRSISYLKGMDILLSRTHTLIKNFSGFAQRISDRLKDRAREIAESQGRPYHYLQSSRISKEEFAREIRERDGVTEGLVCVLACVEPCRSFGVVRNRSTRHVEIRSQERKCLHLYFYLVDREFGPMHVRLQTWLPMGIQVCVNGREYLARRLDAEGIGHEQRDNCLVAVDDPDRAQAILDELVHRDWVPWLSRFADWVNPWLDPAEGFSLRPYYWTIQQCEVATDVVFRDEASLAAIYPALVTHAFERFSCEDGLRFLGRRTNGRFRGEVTTTRRKRTEGVCVKHRVEENTIKMYDKQGRVLRVETTINNPRRFKVRRTTTHEGERRTGWLPLRKGVADTCRRYEISRAENERYLDALAVVDPPSPTHEILDPVQRRITRRGRPYRALRPVTEEECRLFRILLRGEHHLQGIRNADVRGALYPHDEPDRTRRKRASGRVTRWLRLLRAHGLLRKVSGTRYYRVTTKGHALMSTALKLRLINLFQLAA